MSELPLTPDEERVFKMLYDGLIELEVKADTAMTHETAMARMQDRLAQKGKRGMMLPLFGEPKVAGIQFKWFAASVVICVLFGMTFSPGIIVWGLFAALLVLGRIYTFLERDKLSPERIKRALNRSALPASSRAAR